MYKTNASLILLLLIATATLADAEDTSAENSAAWNVGTAAANITPERRLHGRLRRPKGACRRD